MTVIGIISLNLQADGLGDFQGDFTRLFGITEQMCVIISLNSLKGLYSEIYRGLLWGLLREIPRSLDYGS